MNCEKCLNYVKNKKYCLICSCNREPNFFCEHFEEA